MTPVSSAFDRRVAPGGALAEEAARIALVCRAMALRFADGGRLLVFGDGGGSADAQHVAVEFVHPVVVGKRALPALSLSHDAAHLTAVAGSLGFEEVYAAQVRLLATEKDIALGFSSGGRRAAVARGLGAARERGLLTIALVGEAEGEGGGGPVADHVLAARSGDPLVVREIHMTVYHLLWELVHVFLDQPEAAR
ncbi:SIS domain-containing protein [Nonomuraea sp. WAC 01424]|uniref:D-sedoheptulose-7-phosphate isomerase n=1 Tax=Nonomuraea sp. WAC 01424 TaxID=2203200 RepID=UPI001C8C33C1|nr:SIS domain-containing protein [Nonomuraea sp. WAC 01424]